MYLNLVLMIVKLNYNVVMVSVAVLSVVVPEMSP
jgi:hypothetical protein